MPSSLRLLPQDTFVTHSLTSFKSLLTSISHIQSTLSIPTPYSMVSFVPKYTNLLWLLFIVSLPPPLPKFRDLSNVQRLPVEWINDWSKKHMGASSTLNVSPLHCVHFQIWIYPTLIFSACDVVGGFYFQAAESYWRKSQTSAKGVLHKIILPDRTCALHHA